LPGHGQRRNTGGWLLASRVTPPLPQEAECVQTSLQGRVMKSRSKKGAGNGWHQQPKFKPYSHPIIPLHASLAPMPLLPPGVLWPQCQPCPHSHSSVRDKMEEGLRITQDQVEGSRRRPEPLGTGVSGRTCGWETGHALLPGGQAWLSCFQWSVPSLPWLQSQSSSQSHVSSPQGSCES
jgi:hypothetical protein